MCILFIKTNPNPEPGEYRLIIASNRDEHYKRPAEPAFLCPETKIIGGRDLEPGREGGMWLGISTKDGSTPKMCFSALLNVTGAERNNNPAGRGFLVHDFLALDVSAPEYFEGLKKNSNHNAYNLVCLEMSSKDISTYMHSNAPDQSLKFDGEQVLAFGNSPVKNPLKKVKNGKITFEQIVGKSAINKEDLIEALIQLLKSTDRHLPDPELEWRAPSTFEYLSSMFVEYDIIYGTRTHSIILVDYDYNIDFIEHTLACPIDVNNPKWTKTVIKAHL